MLSLAHVGNHIGGQTSGQPQVLFPHIAFNQRVNCTPFVRQYGILFRKWGVFVCQRDNESTTERRR